MHPPLALASALIILSPALALAVDPPDSGRLLRESTPPPALQAPQRPVIEEQMQPERKRAPEGVKIPVTGFIITGNTVFTKDQLLSLVSSYTGKELTLAELEEAARAITNHYRKNGYFLAEAIIPAQTIKSGEPVRIQILEGTLEGVKVETSPKETRTPRRLLENYASRIPSGKPVEEQTLTGTALLLNDLPGISSRFVLEPGATPGTTGIKMELTEGKPYSVSVDGDNHGNYSTGYYRTGAGLELYSPLRLGDQFNLRFQSSTSGETQSVRTGWWVPLNSYGTKVGFDYSYVRYELGRGFRSLDAHGDAHGFNLTMLQPLARKSNLYINATMVGEGRLLDDRVDTAESRNKRHTGSGQAGLSAVYVDSMGGISTMAVTYTAGVLGIDDPVSRANDQSSTGLHTQGVYNKVSGAITRSQSITGNLSAYGSFSGQWTNCNIDSAEQISLGGPYAVRAYPVGEASSDMGLVATAELRYLQPLGPVGKILASGLFDYGYGQIDAKPLPGTIRNVRKIYGAGFGVGYYLHEFISLKTTVAWRMGELPTSDNSNGYKPTVYFQAVLRY